MVLNGGDGTWLGEPRGYAEKKTDTVVVPIVGNNFDSLGEAYDYLQSVFLGN